MEIEDHPRVTRLNRRPIREDARYVLYWMQSSQRAEDNAALHRAVLHANRLSLPVVVCFGLMEDYPDATERAFAFMLEGLAETVATLRSRDMAVVARREHPLEVAVNLAQDAALVVVDAGYLRHLREWRRALGERVEASVECVESDVAVPVETASDKAEYAARTLRPKLNAQRQACLSRTSSLAPAVAAGSLRLASNIDLGDTETVLASLSIDREVPRSRRFVGGLSQARDRLTRFIRQHLEGYGNRRADPAHPSTSELSPYLHFGQIGVAEIADKLLQAKSGSDEDKEALLEELIVRRELAINFVWFTDDYDDYRCLPEWAQKTLSEHREDPRPLRYTRDELEAGETDDPYWNAAMREMRRTGYMHNTLRMYWGKKVLEWCNTPEYAYRTLLYLNNRHFIDGRDPSSYANVGWIFGLHDRAWTERDIFGKVRYMNARGLERKFDIERYVEWTHTL